MAIKKMNTKKLNGDNTTTKTKVFEEPTVNDIYPDEYEEEVTFEPEDTYEEEYVEPEDNYEEEYEEEEEPVKVPPKSVTTKGSTPKTKTTPKVKNVKKETKTVEEKPSNGKKQMMKKKGEAKPKVEKTVDSNVCKRDTILKQVISDLDNAGYEMTLEGMSMIMSSIEKNILAALEEGYRVTFLGNQIKPQERNARVSKAPNCEYATLTDKYTAFVWSRTPNDKNVIRGEYDKDTGVFTDLDGNEYTINDKGEIEQQ